MWKYSLLVSVVVLCIAIGSANLAQEATQPAPPQRVQSVGIIGGSDLNAAAADNTGDDGISRFAELIASYGTTVSTLAPNTEIPPEIQLVVIIAPKRPMSTLQIAYLWDYLQKGGHLLLALDPNGYNGVNTEVARTSGINSLLNTEYGLSYRDDFLIERWFGLSALNSIANSWSEARAENFMPHAITEPLIQYDLPVRFWGARSVIVHSVTGIAVTKPLIYTETPYGETSRINFQATETEQLFLNIGTDTQGRLLVGGIATNRATSSRVAVIGDSEIFENGYGQARIAGNEQIPRYPGTYIFAQRLIGWLLGIPEAEWHTIPDGFTWIELDGLTDDWSTTIPETTDYVFDTDMPSNDIQKVRALHNDQFLYLTVETMGPMPDDTEVLIQMTNGSNQLDITLNHEQQAQVTFNNDLVAFIEDAEYASLAHAEIRLPLRIVGANPVLNRVCISNPELQQPDCLDATIQSTQVNTLEPEPLRFASGPTAFLLDDANMHAAPNESSPVLGQLPSGTILSVVGRSEDVQWVRLRNGRYDGWVVASSVTMNASIEKLPSIPN